MWVFLAGTTDVGSLRIKTDKHIPVQAISSVDYQKNPLWLKIIIVLFIPVALLIPFVFKNIGDGNLIIYTNNTLSTIKFEGVQKDVAQKYMKYMLQCLQERQY